MSSETYIGKDVSGTSFDIGEGAVNTVRSPTEGGDVIGTRISGIHISVRSNDVNTVGCDPPPGIVEEVRKNPVNTSNQAEALAQVAEILKIPGIVGHSLSRQHQQDQREVPKQPTTRNVSFQVRFASEQATERYTYKSTAKIHDVVKHIEQAKGYPVVLKLRKDDKNVELTPEAALGESGVKDGAVLEAAQVEHAVSTTGFFKSTQAIHGRSSDNKS